MKEANLNNNNFLSEFLVSQLTQLFERSKMRLHFQNGRWCCAYSFRNGYGTTPMKAYENWRHPTYRQGLFMMPMKDVLTGV